MTSLQSARQHRLASHRFAFTLAELLIACAIVLLLGAIALPVAFDSLDERAFESAGDSLTQQLVLGRAHAQHSGRTVQVIYDPVQHEVQVSLLDLESLAAGRESQPSPGQDGKGVDLSDMSRRFEALDGMFPAPGDSPMPRDDAILEPWAARPLGGSLWMQQHPPFAEKGDVMTGSFDGVDEEDDATRGTSCLILAVYLPDGTPLVADPMWLVDEDGRAARLTISAWSGEPAIERHSGPPIIADAEEPSDAGRSNDDSGLSSDEGADDPGQSP
jgi:type II secretory pathway pseudopilin PulG